MKSLLETIGNTPLLSLDALSRHQSIEIPILAKAEMFNPGGSVKDRAGAALILDAERRGILRPGGAIIEPTSGNTGIALAWIGAARGYRVILTMPETMSIERRRLLAAFGAEIVLTEGSKGMSGSIEKARQLVESIPGAVILGQFENPANPLVHELTTGPEIIAQSMGQFDTFVAGVGTGGTITGIARALRKANPNVRIVAVEPAGSPVISGGKPGPHMLQGIGAGFIPANLDTSLISEVVTIKNTEAFAACRLLASTHGLLAGISSGAALAAAIKLARQNHSRVVTLLPDTGQRYLSMGLFDPENQVKD